MLSRLSLESTTLVCKGFGQTLDHWVGNTVAELVKFLFTRAGFSNLPTPPLMQRFSCIMSYKG